jgi:hypothetical protein
LRAFGAPAYGRRGPFGLRIDDPLGIDPTTSMQRGNILKAVLLIATGLTMFAAQASAQSKPTAPLPAVEREPSSLSVNLETNKGNLCFWQSSAYSPGSLVMFYDSSRNTNICFHCNADGTWDKPCQ